MWSGPKNIAHVFHYAMKFGECHMNALTSIDIAQNFGLKGLELTTCQWQVIFGNVSSRFWNRRQWFGALFILSWEH